MSFILFGCAGQVGLTICIGDWKLLMIRERLLRFVPTERRRHSGKLQNLYQKGQAVDSPIFSLLPLSPIPRVALHSTCQAHRARCRHGRCPRGRALKQGVVCLFPCKNKNSVGYQVAFKVFLPQPVTAGDRSWPYSTLLRSPLHNPLGH